jgi:hypothetical protein
MRYCIYLFVAVTMMACSAVKTRTLNTIDVKFATMPAIPSGDYEAEATLVFKRNMLKDKDALKNYRQASLSDKVEPINVNINPKTLLGKFRLWRLAHGSIKSGFKLASDPTYDLALFNLAEKYPKVDYWTNIRIERDVRGRKSLYLGLINTFSKNKKSTYIKTGPETVKIKATGIDIMTDAEYEAFKKTPQYDNMKRILSPYSK